MGDRRSGRAKFFTVADNTFASVLAVPTVRRTAPPRNPGCRDKYHTAVTLLPTVVLQRKQNPTRSLIRPHLQLHLLALRRLRLWVHYRRSPAFPLGLADK